MGARAGDGAWTIQHANDRCCAVLGLADITSALLGRDFWDLFSARGSDGGVAAAAAAAARLRGFDADVCAFTDSGRKHWLTASFRTGASEQLDGHCAYVGLPIEVPNEPGAHQAVWFVTLRPMDAAQAPPEELRAAQVAARDVAEDDAALLMERLPAHTSLTRQQVRVRSLHAA